MSPGPALQILWQLLTLPRAASALVAQLPPFTLDRATEEHSPCLRSPLQAEQASPGRRTSEGQAATAPQQVGTSRMSWDTHCKCLKVMSGKPVALDPEGERQSAST